MMAQSYDYFFRKRPKCLILQQLLSILQGCNLVKDRLMGFLTKTL